MMSMMITIFSDRSMEIIVPKNGRLVMQTTGWKNDEMD